MTGWEEYDSWEARDRTLLEAVAHAREHRYVLFEEYGTRAHPGTFLRDALDTIRAERYRSASPDEEHR